MSVCVCTVNLVSQWLMYSDEHRACVCTNPGPACICISVYNTCTLLFNNKKCTTCTDRYVFGDNYCGCLTIL